MFTVKQIQMIVVLIVLMATAFIAAFPEPYPEVSANIVFVILDLCKWHN